MGMNWTSGDTQLGHESGVVALDLLEDRFRVVDEVHLVDGHEHVLDAQERDDEGVTAGLGHDAVARVDEDDGHVARTGPGGHVAGVLLVPRGVGDDELAPVGGEIAVGDVDGDALLALRLEAVGEQGQIDASRGAEAHGVALDGGELILVDHPRVVEQAADERALAVVHAPARQKAQQLLGQK